MSYNNGKLTNLKHLKELAARMKGEHDKLDQKVDTLSVRVDDVTVTGRVIADSMYQEPAFTQYRTTIDLPAGGTGSILDKTVASLLGEDKLAGLTPVGTDDGGNSQYAFVINGVTVGVYTRDAKLSDIMSDINGNEQAGVKVSCSEAAGGFTFTAQKPGADAGIEMGEGLARSMFGPDVDSDGSSSSFAGSYGLGQLTFTVPGGSEKVRINVTQDHTIKDVVNELNLGFQQRCTFSYNQYSGQIEAKSVESGEPVKFNIMDQMGDTVEFDESKTPAVDYTPGQDAVFTAIRVNGKTQSVNGRAVNIAVPVRVSQLSNDSGYQTSSQVETAIQTAVSATGHASFETADTVPAAAEAQSNILYLVMNSETGHYDIYAKVGEEVVLLDDTTVDLSGYVVKEAGKGLSTNDFTDDLKAKLENGPESATDAEVAEMLAEVFGAAS